MTSLTTKFQPIHFMFIIMSLLSILQRTLVTSKFTNQEEGLKVIHEIDSTDIADDDKTISTESSDDNNIFNVNGTISTESSDNIFNVNGIVGGRYSSFGGYPFYASILIHNVKSGKWEAICGGALIDKNWVLSAAHCIVSGYTYAVEIGRYTYNSGNGGQYMEKRKAEIVCTNPKFDKLKVMKDFGLLYFETPSKITPAKLDYGEIKFRESHPFVILGFGSTGSTGQGPFPDVLQAGDVYYVSNDKCGADWDEYIDTSVLCSSSHSSGDSCKGDSGGPLIVNDGKYQNYLAGIVSYGPVPCDGSVPVLYGRVAEAQDWIERVISSTGDTSKCGKPLTFARRRNLLRNYEGITNFQNKNGSFGDFFESNNI